MKITLDVEERISRNQSALESQFRSEKETDIDVEYQKIRLEKVILISCYSSAKTTEKELSYSLDELERLAVTAGAIVMGRLTQQRPLPDASTYIGKGKIDELKVLISELDADTVISNETLQPSQRRALEDKLQTKVIDRTALILDIFAKHAKTKAGRAQVELAQLEYLLPRLRGWGQMMSRQGGGQSASGAGIGSRGPGETQLEIDRRRITSKISLLKKKIQKIRKEQSIANKNRRNSTIPSVSIVGYTNAGKSSLLNLLTDDDILVQDALFATLDTTTRQVKNPRFNITDTVGFIQDLPTTLVEAFNSTLEETKYSDIILHVVDASFFNPSLQIEAVNLVLSQIRSIDGDGKIILKENKNEILVFNKIDLLTEDEIDRLMRLYPSAIFISVKNSTNIKKLLGKIDELIKINDNYKEIKVEIDFNNYHLIGDIYKNGYVKKREETKSGTKITALVPKTFTLKML